MLPRAYLAGLTATVLLACHGAKPSAPLPDTDRPLPLLARPTLDGPALDVAGLSGRVVVVNFWSPGCAPCAKEAPGLQKVAEELAPKGLTLVTVMLEGSEAGARAFVQRAGLKAPVVIGDAELASHFNLVAYPWTVVVGRDGKAVTAARGMRTEDDFRQMFTAAL